MNIYTLLYAGYVTEEGAFREEEGVRGRGGKKGWKWLRRD